MENTKTQKVPTIFELTEIEYQDSYDEENDELIAPQYPDFEVRQSRMGIFSTLSKAEQAMKEYIAKQKKYGEEQGKDYLKKLFGFLIDEHKFDKCSWWWRESVRNYLHDGSLLDECLVSDTLNDDDALEEFLGRPAEKVRFRNGELVEVLHGDRVTLEIVGNPPWSPEKVSANKIRVKEKFGNDFRLDSSDDRYFTLGVSDEDDEVSHDHPTSVQIFPLRFPVSEALRSNLEKRYLRYKK
jgi:hypothetical protein